MRISTIWTTKISKKRSTRTSNIGASFQTATLTFKSGLDDSQAGLFSDAFADQAVSFSCRKIGDGWELFWTFGMDVRPDRADLVRRLEIYGEAIGVEDQDYSSLTIADMEDRNWLAESYRALPPIEVGSFFIYGSHFNGTLPTDKLLLLIEAATAFGSGEHGTTAACIEALEHLKKDGVSPLNILDMGCGSGILAAAAARLWPGSSVFAADNDPECVIVTNRHLETNDIEGVTVFQSEGYEASSQVWKHAPFDLIVANILAAPLIDMAAEQSKAVAQGGYLILSGTLTEQAERVMDAYTPHDFQLVKAFVRDEWTTLLVQKN